MYLREGTATTRCGSFASRGLPLSVSLPEIVQLLLSASALPENSIRVSLPTKPRKSLADSPRKSAFGAGSRATTGSRLSNWPAFSVPTAATSCACCNSRKALPVMENAAMRFKQSSGFQFSGSKPAIRNSTGSPGPFGLFRSAINALIPSVNACRISFVSCA